MKKIIIDILVSCFWLVVVAGCFITMDYFFNKVNAEVNREEMIRCECLYNKTSFKVEITAYSMSPDETEGDPTITATMTKATPGKTIAVSRDLAPYLLGKKVYVEGFGIGLVEDLMNKRHENMIDILMPSKQAAIDFGRKEGYIIVVE